MITGRTLLAVAVVAWAGSMTAGAQDTPRIWQGVYTAAQAERGKTTYNSACIRCHGADLGGTTAPALKGDRFMTTFGNDTVDRLFLKIRDTMPPNFGSSLDDETKIDIVSYLLQTNGYPTGARELTTSGDELAAMQILRQGEQASVNNFSLVQTVGCLAKGPDSAWMLTQTAEPVATRDDTPTADAVTAAGAKPLGSGQFRLLSAAPHNPAAHVGHKMEARGLIYRDSAEARLTLTSLRMIGSC